MVRTDRLAFGAKAWAETRLNFRLSAERMIIS